MNNNSRSLQAAGFRKKTRSKIMPHQPVLLVKCHDGQTEALTDVTSKEKKTF